MLRMNLSKTSFQKDLNIMSRINWKYNLKLLIESIEDFTRKLTKPEKEATLSKWVKSVRSLIQIRISTKDFKIDNIFVQAGSILHQTIGLSMGANLAPL